MTIEECVHELDAMLSRMARNMNDASYGVALDKMSDRIENAYNQLQENIRHGSREDDPE